MRAYHHLGGVGGQRAESVSLTLAEPLPQDPGPLKALQHLTNTQPSGMGF